MIRREAFLQQLAIPTAMQVAHQSMQPSQLALREAQSRNVELLDGGNHRWQPQLVQETWASWYLVQNCLM
jgi:hypothetical protein